MTLEVVDALGCCELRRRSADLDGSIPLRAARACVPLLEGNAFGWSICASVDISLVRRRSRWRLADDDLVRRARAAVPYLMTEGLLPTGTWAHQLADGPLFELDGRVALWTGLLLRSATEQTLWSSDAGARRNRDVAVGELARVVGPRWMPLVLELRPRPRLERCVLGGELATLAAVDPVSWRFVDLADARDIGEAHLRFYDAAYFADKREGPTRKYRRMLGDAVDARVSVPTVVRAGSCTVAAEACEREHTADGVVRGRLQRLVFRNALRFEARFDGRKVHVDADRDQLARNASAIDACWRGVFGEQRVAEQRGALWYLTKYFTPHVDGEPHFFVKPGVLSATPAGVATLVDGIGDEGYDVLRGVVRTDRFGAVPAVFSMWGSGTTIEVPVGRPLARMLAFRHGADAPTLQRHAPLPMASRR